MLVISALKCSTYKQFCTVSRGADIEQIYLSGGARLLVLTNTAFSSQPNWANEVGLYWSKLAVVS